MLGDSGPTAATSSELEGRLEQEIKELKVLSLQLGGFYSSQGWWKWLVSSGPSVFSGSGRETGCLLHFSLGK